MPTSPLNLDLCVRPRQNDEVHGMALVAKLEAQLAQAPACPEPQPAVVSTP